MPGFQNVEQRSQTSEQCAFDDTHHTAAAAMVNIRDAQVVAKADVRWVSMHIPISISTCFGSVLNILNGVHLNILRSISSPKLLRLPNAVNKFLVLTMHWAASTQMPNIRSHPFFFLSMELFNILHFAFESKLNLCFVSPNNLAEFEFLDRI